MELKHATAPYFRQRESVQSIGLSRLIAAGGLLVSALFIYGFRALFMAVSGILGAVATEALWQFMRRREASLGDLSAVYTGMMCALLMPAAAPIWLPFAAGVFAVGVVKLPFGSLGRSPFSAEAGGYCFAVLVGANLLEKYNTALLSPTEQQLISRLPDHVFGCAKDALPLLGDVPCSPNISDMLSTQMQLRVGLDPGLNIWGLLFTGVAGAMGAAVTVMSLVCAGWLLSRRALAWQSSFAYVVTLACLSLVVPYRGISFLERPLYEVLAGSALLCAVFLAGDILTTPHTGSGRAIYGLAAGVLTVIFRRIGSAEGGEVFALLLMTALASPIDYFVFFCRGRGISLAAYRHRISAAFKKKFGAKSRFDIDVDELYEELEREKREKKKQGGQER